MKSKLLTILMAMITTIAAAAELNVVPAVQQWTPAEGTFDASHAVFVTSNPDFQEVVRRANADRPLIVTPTGRIELRLAPIKDLQPEGYYTIEIGDKVVVSGVSPTGVFYGTRTLLQLLRQSPHLPKGKIVDWPEYKHRMLMLDVGRKPFPMSALKDYLRILAWYKMNELHLHLSDEAFGERYYGFRVQCDTFPGLASKDLFYTKKELREFQDEAKAMGITVTPELDMPGHARVFTAYWPDLELKGHPNYLDVTNPKTIERMKKLLDEMIPIFDAPDFHIGTDEYRVGGPDKEKLHEAFRQFINTMNAHIRSKGKNTRIWSGFESMGGKQIKIDPTVIVDMWDPYNAEHDGHPVINSYQGVTYYVPGCHYYGVNPGSVYNNWEPWRQGLASAPKKDDPRLLGGKLHVWNDQGPTGYTMTEIATLVLPGIQAFAEKLWGAKGFATYPEFQKRAAKTLPVPDVTVFERRPATGLELAGERTFTSTNTVIPWLTGRADLEQPWTLTMEIMPTADTGKRGVILSSDLAEICASYNRDGKTGIGVIRAAGSRDGADPASSHLVKDVSRVYSDPVPLNKWTTVTIVSEDRRTTVYLNGAKTGDSNNQTLCPLAQFGSKTGNSFVGKIRNLKVHNRALTAKEIGRAAGLDIPDNLAAGCPVKATASDTGNGFVPGNATDDNPATRWSSGPTGAEQKLTIDLGKPKVFNTVTISWENAHPNEFRLAVSDDGQHWLDIAHGAGKVGLTETAFPSVTARYLSIYMSKPATGWGYSIWGVEVLNKRS